MKIKLNRNFIQKLADKYNIDISGYRMDQLIQGYKIELEHDPKHKPEIDVIKKLIDPLKIAIIHLDEYPDYYDRLEKVEIKEIVRKILRRHYV